MGSRQRTLAIVGLAMLLGCRASRPAEHPSAASLLPSGIPLSAMEPGNGAVVPLPAHSHNDYWRPRPLLDAVELGFRSVEADVFPGDRDLLVAHFRLTCRADRTLEALYLHPLRERLERGGSVLGSSLRAHGGFLLLVDCKENGQRCLKLLERKLRPLRQWLTRREGGRVIPGELTVVVSGARPVQQLRALDPAYVFLDARPHELGRIGSDLAPLVSASWRSRFRWRGRGPMPGADARQLAADVRAARAGGQLLRYWALPHDEGLWRTLRNAGVSLLQADDIERLAEFLESEPDAPWNPNDARR